MCPEIEISNNYTEIHCIDYQDCVINTLDYNKITYSAFFDNYMLKNVPCIIKNVSNEWNSSKNWVKDGCLNYNHFIKHYGDLTAPVADCNNIAYNAHSKMDMTVNNYMSYLQNPERENLFYLKDWHLKRMVPGDDFYKVPFIFASDWLNEYALDNNQDDFMFVYIGPKHSWTPLHSDVYNSYSWSVNIIGKKKWIFFPPGEENKLKDSLGNLPLMYEPRLHNNVKYFEIIQETGDAIFVPSGWHHQVTNMLDTISINHNWVNACNLHIVWNAMKKCLDAVEHEIIEFKNTEEYFMQCQLILKNVFGMDYQSFSDFLFYIGNKRLKQLMEPLEGCHGCRLGTNHIKFDLHIILNILNSFIDLISNTCTNSNQYPDAQNLKTNIIKSINKE